MSEEQWAVLAGHVDLWWPATEFTEDHEKAYYEVLKDFDAEQVEVAIRDQLERGEDFAPSAARLLKALRPLDHGLTFEQVMQWIETAANRIGADERRTLHWLWTKHEWAMAWVQQYGWDRLRMEPFNDPDTGGAVLWRLRKSWEAFVVDQEGNERRRRAIGTTERSGFSEPHQLRGENEQLEAG